VPENSTHTFASLGLPESSPRKKVKLSKAVHSVTSSVEQKILGAPKSPQDTVFTLGEKEICIVVAFIVKFVMLTVAGDTSVKRLGKKGITLFRHVISR